MILNSEGLFTGVLLANMLQHLPLLNFLLQRSKFDVNRSINQEGDTLLHMHAKGGYREAMAVILSFGPNVNLENNECMTPLMCSAMKDNLGTLLLLVKEESIKINQKSSNLGVTALLYAAPKGSREMVDALLEHGADSSISSDAGLTPLMVAANSGNLGAVISLVEHGADVKLKLEGVSVLDMAQRKKHEKVVEYLKSKM